jgi:hypothetical protein
MMDICDEPPTGAGVTTCSNPVNKIIHIDTKRSSPKNEIFLFVSKGNILFSSSRLFPVFSHSLACDLTFTKQAQKPEIKTNDRKSHVRTGHGEWKKCGVPRHKKNNKMSSERKRGNDTFDSRRSQHGGPRDQAAGKKSGNKKVPGWSYPC